MTLVQFLSSPAAAEVNGQVFIVYGPQVTLVAAPTAEQRFSADGAAWEPAKLSRPCRITLLGATRRRTFPRSA